MKVCMHKLLGHCPGCTPDVDTSHHPNNLDCIGYTPIGLNIMEVKNEEEQSKSASPQTEMSGREQQSE